MIQLKNKKGRMVLRDIIFMLLMFAGVVALASILVTQMGNEYDNDEMVSSYNQETIGKNTLTTEANTWGDIADDLSGKNGIPALVGGGLEALGVILVQVIVAPATFAQSLTSTLEIFGVSEDLIDIAGFILTGLLYVLIVFAIAKVFLRGGDI
ncbi:MAG: hypothetical protein ACOC5T_01760 [Elusimicrobiota bacterium]